MTQHFSPRRSTFLTTSARTKINFGGDFKVTFYFSLLGLTISIVLLNLFGTDIGTIFSYLD